MQCNFNFLINLGLSVSELEANKAFTHANIFLLLVLPHLCSENINKYHDLQRGSQLE
jgi:hypothetical protein